MDKYKKLSDVKEMKLFEAVCALQFNTSKPYIASTAQPKSSHKMKSNVAHSPVDVVLTTSCKYLRKQLHTARLKLLAHKQQQKYIQCDLENSGSQGLESETERSSDCYFKEATLT